MALSRASIATPQPALPDRTAGRSRLRTTTSDHYADLGYKCLHVNSHKPAVPR